MSDSTAKRIKKALGVINSLLADVDHLAFNCAEDCKAAKQLRAEVEQLRVAADQLLIGSRRQFEAAKEAELTAVKADKLAGRLESKAKNQLGRVAVERKKLRVDLNAAIQAEANLFRAGGKLLRNPRRDGHLDDLHWESWEDRRTDGTTDPTPTGRIRPR